VSGSTGTLWRQLHETGAPLSLVLYSSPAALEDVIETVHLVAPDELKLVRTRDVEDVFTQPDVPLLLTPDQEAAAVVRLDGRREALLDRTATAILFLLKDGSGERELRERAFELGGARMAARDRGPGPGARARPRAHRGEVASHDAPRRTG
jgi:hypothetical protein